MNHKATRIIVILSAALIILVGSFSGGFLVGNAFSQLPWHDRISAIGATATPAGPDGLPGITAADTAAPVTDRDTLFAPFWQAWDILHEMYVDQPVNDVKLMQGAIRGMLDSLGDEHTSYMDPDELNQAEISLDGEYEGIGAWVDITGDYLKIISPMPGSPAEKAGLKPEDLVIGIDGEDMTGLDGNIVLNKILGPAGTDVTLTVRRESTGETLEFHITRAKILVPSVTSKMLDGKVAYVQLSSFGDTTGADLQAQLKDLLQQAPVGLVLDLRYNGGGLLTAAVDVASQFISQDVVMYEEFGDGNMNELKTHGSGLARDIPLVVLVNDGTASASEIVAGAIQDYGRGKLVGIQTFGKGSVQNWIELKNGQGGIRVTIAHWLTPLKRQIHKIGLTPDVIVEQSDADTAKGVDTQLMKALEVLGQ